MTKKVSPRVKKRNSKRKNLSPKKNLPTIHWEKFYHYHLLEPAEKAFLHLFPREFLKESYDQVAKQLSLTTKRSARHFLVRLEEKGFINKELNYIPNTRIHLKNYYTLTKKGALFRKALVHKAYSGENVPTKLNPGLTIQDGSIRRLTIQEFKDLEELERQEALKKKLEKEEARKRKLEELEKEEGRDLEKGKREEIRDDREDKEKPHAHKELTTNVVKISSQEKQVFGPSLEDKEKREKLEEKKKAIKKLFDENGFNKELDKGTDSCFKLIINASLEKIRKILSFISGKINKGFRIRNFWGFFMSIWRDDGDPFWKKRSRILEKALREEESEERRKFKLGEDSRIILDGLQEIEKITGEPVSSKFLDRLCLATHGDFLKLSTAFRIWNKRKRRKGRPLDTVVGPGLLAWIASKNFKSKEDYFNQGKKNGVKK